MSQSFEDFTQATHTYDELVAPKPATVEHDALLESLDTINQLGSAAVRANEVGAVNFANQMTERYAGALSLNEQGLVQPPLTEQEVKDITARIDTLSILTVANGEAGGMQQAPTDPNNLKTDDQK